MAAIPGEQIDHRDLLPPWHRTRHPDPAADRGSVITAKATGHFLADLGITKTPSRPYQSNDNPYSESHFKTMEYRPEFLDRFGSIQDARAFCRSFFDWYNNRHHHSGIGLLTPQQG